MTSCTSFTLQFHNSHDPRLHTQHSRHARPHAIQALHPHESWPTPPHAARDTPCTAIPVANLRTTPQAAWFLVEPQLTRDLSTIMGRGPTLAPSSKLLRVNGKGGKYDQ